MYRTKRRSHLVAILIVAAVPFCGGCELVVEALKDGVADFLESTTADLLEEAFPAPKLDVSEITK